MVTLAASWWFWAKSFVQLVVGSRWSLSLSLSLSLSRSFYGGSLTLVECYKKYLRSRHTKLLVYYPTFDVRLLKCCLQKTALLVFGTADPSSVTEFIDARSKGAEHRDWMQSQQSLRMAIESGGFWFSGLVDDLSNVFGVWPLVVSCSKKTGTKDGSDSLVV